jgi:hypothetical protein
VNIELRELRVDLQQGDSVRVAFSWFDQKHNDGEGGYCFGVVLINKGKDEDKAVVTLSGHLDATTLKDERKP